jgi:hypothetical protein
LEDLGVDGTLILKWLFKKWDKGKDWIDVAQDNGMVASTFECGEFLHS